MTVAPALPISAQLAGVVVVAALAQAIAAALRVPSILTLLLAGIAVGPVLGWIVPSQFLPLEVLGGAIPLAVAIILFEGGLSLRIAELREAGWVVIRLVLLGGAVTWLVATAGASWLLELPPPIAALLGSILMVSGPTVIGPLLRELRPTGRVGPVLKWEGIVIDLVGVVVATLVYESISAGGATSLASAALLVGSSAAVGVTVGLVGSYLVQLVLARSWLPDALLVPGVLGVVVAAFESANQLRHESGLVAVTVMGFHLANQRRVRLDDVVRFKEELTRILIAYLFVVLAARLPGEGLRQALTARGLAFIVLLVGVARPLAVLIGTIGTSLSWRERGFLAWAYPRGIVAASLASLLAVELQQARFPGAERLEPITYLVIISLIVLYGSTLPAVGRVLRMVLPDPQGVLLVGAHPLARDMAAALGRAGASVRLVDTNRRNVVEARMAGLSAQHVNVLADGGLDRADLGGIGWMVALTSNDEVNALAAIAGGRLLGSARVYQLAPRAGRGAARGIHATRASGRVAFDPSASYEELERRFDTGASVRGTSIAPEVDEARVRVRGGAEVLPLFRVWPGGAVEVVTPESGVAGGPRYTLVSLVGAGADAERPAPTGTAGA